MLTYFITISEYSFLVIYSVCLAYFLGKQGNKNKKQIQLSHLPIFSEFNHPICNYHSENQLLKSIRYKSTLYRTQKY